MMKSSDSTIVKLIELSDFLETEANRDDCLRTLAAMLARIVGTKQCAIMLLDNGYDKGGTKPRAFVHHGFPSDACEEASHRLELFASHAASSRSAFFVTEAGRNPFSPRWTQSKSLCMAAPILSGDRTIGVIAIFPPKAGRRFTRHDLNLLTIAARVISKSFQTMQLQTMPNSLFTRIAMGREAKKTTYGNAAPPPPDCDKMAKILAKSFYREMTRIGFGTNQVINAATEIISLLNENLARHRGRVKNP
jgi:hypothetical protein